MPGKLPLDARPERFHTYDPKQSKGLWQWLGRHTGKLFFLLVVALWCTTLVPSPSGKSTVVKGRPSVQQLAECINAANALQQTTYHDFAVSKPSR